jgi:hypothetical protein
MNNILSTFIFILCTWGYYKVKTQPKLNPDGTIEQPNYQTNLMILLGYIVLATIIQYILNLIQINQTCGTLTTKALNNVSLNTFVPWIIFLMMISVALIIFPGWKSAFTDTIGYSYIAGKAKKYFAELFIDENIQEALNSVSDPTKKTELEKAATAISKICGNQYIIINNITPDNFSKMWTILTPLIKDPLQKDTALIFDYQKKILDLVIQRDCLGESVWYIYTAILIGSLVSYLLVKNGC